MHTLRIWLALIAAAFLVFAPAMARDVRVKGYTRKDGTYVAPHTRTSPNRTRNDNYSTKGNVNPYTGKVGTRPRDADTYPPASPKTESTSPARSRPAVQAATPPRTDSPVIGWRAVTSGMPESELKRQLGMPRVVEGKSSYEIWDYPTGTVYVKDRKVVAWKQAKAP